MMCVQSFTATSAGFACGWVSMPIIDWVRKVYSSPTEPRATPKRAKKWAMEWIIPTSFSKPVISSKRATLLTSSTSVEGTPIATRASRVTMRKAHSRPSPPRIARLDPDTKELSSETSDRRLVYTAPLRLARAVNDPSTAVLLPRPTVAGAGGRGGHSSHISQVGQKFHRELV
jgi:hypothetical protein